MIEFTVYGALTKHLASTQYMFICPSPETARRVVEKRTSDPSTQQDMRELHKTFLDGVYHPQGMRRYPDCVQIINSALFEG